MDNRSRFLILAALAVLLLTALPIRAQEELSVPIPNPGNGDGRAYTNWIDQTSTGTNNKAATDLFIQAGVSAPIARRAVLLFDTSSIPRSGIKAATLVGHLDVAPTTARTWEVHQLTAFTNNDPSSAANETWTASGLQTNWTTAGGDFSGTVVGSTSTGTTSGATLTWPVLSLLRQWFGEVPPAPNYGLIIKDSSETGAASTLFGELASWQTATPANAPTLYVDFIQEIQALTATATTGGVTLTWTYPTAVGTTSGSPLTGSALGLHPTTGIMIVRSTDAPVPDAYLGPTDGLLFPSLCSTPATGVTVVFTAATTATTTFTDPATTGTCPAATGHTYFYKAFAAAFTGSGFNYSTNGTGGTQDTAFAAEISGTVSATPQAPVWVAPVRASALVAPGIDAGNPVTDNSCDCIVVADNNPIVQVLGPTNGTDSVPPIPIGGPISTRPPVLDGNTNDNSSYTGTPFTYTLSAQTAGVGYSQEDNIVLGHGGFILDAFNPLAGTVPGGPPPLTGGMAIYVKNLASASDTEPADLHVYGTQAAANTTNNAIVGEDGNNGEGSNGDGWVVIGGTTTSYSCSATAGTAAACNLDAVTSTPQVDYVHNTVWVTSHNGGTSAGTVAQPDIWKLNLLGCVDNVSSPTCNGANNTVNNSEVLAAINVGSNIDSSPSLSGDSKFVFVGTSSASPTLYAFDAVATGTFGGTPVAPAELASVAVSGDGPIKGFPLVLGTGPTYQVIFSTNTQVHSRTFNSSGDTFTTTWDNTTLGCNVSSVITAPGAVDTNGAPRPVVYVGCSDGKLHELITSSGVDEDARVVDASATTGDPTLDTTDSLVIVGSTDGRIYAFKFPF